jgi:transposase
MGDERNRRFVEIVKRLSAERGFAPSMEEISEELGCSIGTVRTLIQRFVREGRATYEAHTARSLRLVEKAAGTEGQS